MIHTLIVYGTRRGTTENTANVIGETLILKHNHIVEVTNVRNIRKYKHRLDDFNLIIVGSSIISGRWVRRAIRFLRKYDFINQKVAIFITAGITLNKGLELGLKKEDVIHEAISIYIDKYLPEFKFSPISKMAFGGLIIRSGKEKLNSWIREDIESWAIRLGKLVGKNSND
jgi:menaquinone-dependent protoporphyrinogen IX oxidase